MSQVQVKQSINTRRWFVSAGLGLAAACGACAAPSVAQQKFTPPSTFHEPPQTALTQQQDSVRPAGSVRLGTRRAPSPGAIQPVAYTQDVLNGPSCPPEAITSCPPEPRVPFNMAQPFAIGMPACDAACQPSPLHYPDEYLCDGGDRDWPVHYQELERHGLDTEDTIAEYTDHRGRQRTMPSNKVCVYAPRFASVRTLSLPHEEGTINQVAGTENTYLGGEVRTRLAPNLGNKNISLSGVQMRSRASGLEGELVATNASQRQHQQVHDKVLNTFQDIGFFQSGIFEQGDLARLNLGIHNAQSWSQEQYPVLQGKTETANTGVMEVRTSVLTVVDDTPSDKPGQLRIIKVADKSAAAPGEVITFTIRYDNLGGREVTAMRIVDNLTPRLEYVDDSATSDRVGRLVVQDNGEGSLVLVWEMEEPLQPKTGGVVTFQARVR